jgi:hypothetical protein
MGRRTRITALTALAATMAAGVLVTGLAQPAYAERVSDIYCDYAFGRYTRLKITATAYYTDNVDGPGIRRWYEFRYRLDGGGDKSNVNIRLSESGRQIFALDSPDNRTSDTFYSVRPANPVHTSVWGPEGEHDHRANDVIEFKAIFDIGQTSDPRCTAWAKI